MNKQDGVIKPLKVKAFQTELLAWGKTNRRKYPWRNTSDPYRVLVAELMLQRTGPEQVLPVYVGFLDRYPDINKLSNAKIEDIRQVITSLGLAYRAERIGETARQVVEKYGGKVPVETEKLLKLKGIGTYIAHAVPCMTDNVNLPMFDTNVARILKRVFSIETGKDPHKKKKNWELMKKIMPEGKAKEFNLTLIDFGSFICTGKNPKHSECPMKEICDFYSN